MLIFKTRRMFIKNKKKTKYGKRIYKKKYFTTVYQNEMKIGIVTKTSIRKSTKIPEPIKPEDCLGYNKELQELFKTNPPIPVNDTNKNEVTEQDATVLKGGVRLCNTDDHGNLVRVTKELQEEIQNSYSTNINPLNITPLPFRESGKHKDWLIKKIEDVENKNTRESEYFNIWIETPSTIEVIDE